LNVKRAADDFVGGVSVILTWLASGLTRRLMLGERGWSDASSENEKAKDFIALSRCGA